MTAGIELVESPEIADYNLPSGASFNQGNAAAVNPNSANAWSHKLLGGWMFVLFPCKWKVNPPLSTKQLQDADNAAVEEYDPGQVVVTDHTPVFSGPIYNLDSLDDLPEPIESHQQLEHLEGDESDPFSAHRYRLITTHILPPVVVYAPPARPAIPEGEAKASLRVGWFVVCPELLTLDADSQKGPPPHSKLGTAIYDFSQLPEAPADPKKNPQISHIFTTTGVPCPPPRAIGHCHSTFIKTSKKC